VKETRSEQIADIRIAAVAELERYSKKIVEDVRAAAEIASKQKHSPAREQLVASSIVRAPDLLPGGAC
jgi:hypothetical protein